MSTPSNDKPWWVPEHATGWQHSKQYTPGPSVTHPPSVTATTLSAANQIPLSGPSLLAMASNLASTALSAARHAAHTGAVMVTEEEANKRISICEGCEFLDKSVYRCLKCGCMMRFKTKVLVAKCPVGKW